MPIKILLVDDHVVVREGVRLLLETQPDMQVIASVGQAREALRQARELRPDVAIMDISMPGLSGVEAVRLIRASAPDVKVLMLSMQESPEVVYRALEAGARGYLLKESAAAELIAAVRAVQAGRRYLGDRINETVIARYLDPNRARSPLDSLSERERSVLRLVAEGLSNSEAAKELCLSVKTVETYRSRLMRKLGLGSLPELVKFSIQQGLVQLK